MLMSYPRGCSDYSACCDENFLHVYYLEIRNQGQLNLVVSLQMRQLKTASTVTSYQAFYGSSPVAADFEP